MKKELLVVLLLFVGLTGFRYFPTDYKLFFRVAEQMPGKTLTVVVRGDSKEDDQLREAVKQKWTVSPYEFVTPEEADKLASDTGRVFLFKAWLSGRESPLADYKLYLSKGRRAAKKHIETQLLDNFEIFICSVADYKKFDTEAEFSKLPYLQIIALNRIHLGLIAGAKSNRDPKVFADLTVHIFKPKKGTPEEFINKKIYYDADNIPEKNVDDFCNLSKLDRSLFSGVDSKKLADIMLSKEKSILLMTYDGKKPFPYKWIKGSYSIHDDEGKYYFNEAILDK